MLVSRISMVVLLVSSATFAGCAEKTETGASPTPTTPGANMTAPTIVKLAVTAQDTPPQPQAGASPNFYGWTPRTLAAKLNDTIDITLKGVATNQLTHNLVISDFQVKISGVKESTTGKNATFVAAKKGTFNYFCDVGGTQPNNHRALGMTGSLVIS